jgi:hypothetical protein
VIAAIRRTDLRNRITDEVLQVSMQRKFRQFSRLSKAMSPVNGRFSPAQIVRLVAGL